MIKPTHQAWVGDIQTRLMESRKEQVGVQTCGYNRKSDHAILKSYDIINVEGTEK